MKHSALAFVIALGLSFPVFAGAQTSEELATLIEAHRAESPEDFEAVAGLRIIRNRNGTHRVLGTRPGTALVFAHLHVALDEARPESHRLAHARAAGDACDSVEVVELVLALDSAPQARRAFIRGLRNNQEAITEPLARFATQAENVDDRRIAFFVLTQRPDRDAHAELFASGAEDVDPEVRRLAVEALGWITAVSDIPVIRALRDSNVRVQMAALRALARLNPAAAREHAENFVDNEHLELRRVAQGILDAER